MPQTNRTVRQERLRDQCISIFGEGLNKMPNLDLSKVPATPSVRSDTVERSRSLDGLQSAAVLTPAPTNGHANGHVNGAATAKPIVRLRGRIIEYTRGGPAVYETEHGKVFVPASLIVRKGGGKIKRRIYIDCAVSKTPHKPTQFEATDIIRVGLPDA